MCQEKKWFILSLLSVMIVLMLTGGVQQVQPQVKYPTRPIDLFVPFSPGGFTDLSNRLVAAYMEKKWHMRLNVVNKPGGNTVPAFLEVYHSKPDGYTLYGDSMATPMLKLSGENIPFEIMDRTFVAMLNTQPLAVVVPSESPVKSLKDLEAEVKKDPNNFKWASTGTSDITTWTFRQFFKALGVNILKTKPVMAKGGSEVVALVSGGHVAASSIPVSTGLAAIKGGLVRVLALTAEKRYPSFPDLPTTAEQGYPMVNAKAWNGITGPPNLPSYIIEIWDKAVQDYLKDPEAISQLAKVTAVPLYRNSREFKEFVFRQIEEGKELWGLK